MSSPLNIRPAEDCRWDMLSLGEVMLRLDPGDRRVRTATTFTPSEGGGEYNVARALSAVFAQRSTVVTALCDNEIGHLVKHLAWTGGVDTSHVVWRSFDGIGTASRNGLNFTEAGFGVRPAMGVSDRGHTAVSQLEPGEVDWHQIFEVEGVRWMHTGGIFSALSPTTAEVTLEATRAAKASGTIVSYDLNYRPSLWKSRGGSAASIEVNTEIATMVDVMLGNEEDFTAALGFEVPELDHEMSKIDPTNFRTMIGAVTEEYPNLSIVGTTLRNAKTASTNDWGAIIWADRDFHEARSRPDLDILDRVGGGDGFASGLSYAFLAGMSAAEAVEWGCTHGALVMTTPGDTSMVTRSDVERAISASGARVVR